MVRSYLGHSPIIPELLLRRRFRTDFGASGAGRTLQRLDERCFARRCAFIRLGANSNVQDCAVLHGMRYKHPVEVGDWVTIGHNATVHGCVIEDACLIGMGATILNNARIGEGSIIAAGAVVTGEHGGSGKYALGWCAGQRAAPAGPQRARDDPAVRPQLRRLHGYLLEGTGEVVETRVLWISVHGLCIGARHFAGRKRMRTRIGL